MKKKKIEKVKMPLKSFGFWVKIFAVSLLLALGFLILFNETNVLNIILIFFGATFIVYAIYRLFLLFKVYKKTNARLLGIIEILIDMIVGILSLVLGIFASNTSEEIYAFANNNYNLFIAILLWIRGFTYFTTIFLFDEKTDKYMYFIHLAIFTVGSMLFTFKISLLAIAYGIMIISFVSAFCLFISGFKDYRRYLKLKDEIIKKQEELKNEVKEEKIETKEEVIETKEEESSEEIKTQISEDIVALETSSESEA